MEERPRLSVVMQSDTERYSPATPSQDFFSFKARRKTSESMESIRHYTDEPNFWRGYTSEEEVASPVDTDELSFRTTSSAASSPCPSSHESFPEQLAISCNKVERQCNRAQAVTLRSAGKAKVVSMPKLVDVTATPRSQPSSRGSSARAPISRMHRLTMVDNAHVQSSPPWSQPFSSPPSSPPQSVARVVSRGRSVRPQPSLPNLQATARTQASTPRSTPEQRLPSSASFLMYDPFPSSLRNTPTTPTSPPPTSPSRRRLHKFSSSIGLNVFGKGIKQSTSSGSSIDEDFEAVKEPEPILVRPSSATVARPPSRAKLVPRGANERAPPLILPPCPDDYESVRDTTQWLFRKDAATNAMSREPKWHKRQRSVSAALVSAQA
jgi:hypothetical protein